MRLISAQDGKLIRLQEQETQAGRLPGFSTGLPAFDALLPTGGFKRGAVHELLHQTQHPQPRFVAATLTRAALTPFDTRHSSLSTSLVWFDPDHTLYPPALAQLGIDLSRLYIARPRTEADLIWGMAECLRCPAVAVTVGPVDRLSRVDARKLQLAAEQGGGAGIFMRPESKHASTYAAATRWRVSPAAGERNVQRWTLQLIHGHGGHVNTTICLEHHRETHLLRAIDQLPDRSRETTLAS